MTAPSLTNDEGWHSYPPSDKFKQDDDVGISGTKTFETVLSAKERKTQLPPVSFAFFDPIKETYVALKSDPIPLQIEGAPLSTPTPAVASASPNSQQPPAIPAPAKTEQDILYQLAERPAHPESFTPIYQRPAFWAAQLLPLLALAGLVGWKMRQARAGNRAAQRIARLQQEAAELQRKLRRNGESPREYVASAARAVQLKTALAREVDPDAVDAEVAAEAFQANADQRMRLQRLFAESDELRYSGGRNGGAELSAERREEIRALVEELRS